MHKYFLAATLLTLCSSSLASSQHPWGFEGPEHAMIGETVQLHFPGASPTKLHLNPTLTLSYGEIVALSGDFYGVIDAPISKARTAAEQVLRFEAAFNTLVKAEKEPAEILALINAENNDVVTGMAQGEKSADIYNKIGPDYSMAFNCLTGGFCPSDAPGASPETLHKIYILKQGRYLKLADTDFDHFGQQARIAYRIGHRVASDAAIAAGKNNDSLALEKAYAMNAFACHFLSDSFSTGHMRTPRLELSNLVFPATVGSILASYMHAEDNESGLSLSNQMGDNWTAWGDKYYLDERNQTNRALLQKAMQASADDIYTAFLTGHAADDASVEKLLPDLDTLVNEDLRATNSSPLFVWDTRSSKLLRRVRVNDRYDFEWTPNWLGWTTLIELLHDRGMPSIMQTLLLSRPDTHHLAQQAHFISVDN